MLQPKNITYDPRLGHSDGFLDGLQRGEFFALPIGEQANGIFTNICTLRLLEKQGALRLFVKPATAKLNEGLVQLIKEP